MEQEHTVAAGVAINGVWPYGTLNPDLLEKG